MSRITWGKRKGRWVARARGATVCAVIGSKQSNTLYAASERYGINLSNPSYPRGAA